MSYAISSASIGRYVPRFFRTQIMTRLAVWRSRRALAKLDERGLQDIGVTLEEAKREASLTVWDVPASWTHK